MTFKWRCTSRSYAIEIPDLQVIEDKDRDEVGDPLWKKLSEIDGVSEVDYNGHFGHNVYLTIGGNSHEGGVMKKVSEVIKDHSRKEGDFYD